MVRLIRKLVLTVIAMLFAPFFLPAQTNEIGGIGTFGLTKDLGESMGVGISQELRFNQDFTNFDRALTGLEVDYTLIRKLLKAEVGYDFIYQTKNDYNEFRHRASLGLSLQKKYNPLTFKLRTKAQSTWRDESRGDYKYNPKLVWRNKMECVYTIFGSSWKPFASAELFCPVNGTKGFYLDGYRAIIGAKYRVSVRTSLEFMLRYDQDVQQANPKGILYGGFGWSYSL